MQQTWINNPVFGGLFNETDPLIGQRGIPGDAGDDNRAQAIMTVQGEPLRTRVHGLGEFVTVNGGAYFFLPGIRALRFLASIRDSTVERKP